MNFNEAAEKHSEQQTRMMLSRIKGLKVTFSSAGQVESDPEAPEDVVTIRIIHVIEYENFEGIPMTHTTTVSAHKNLIEEWLGRELAAGKRVLEEIENISPDEEEDEE